MINSLSGKDLQGVRDILNCVADDIDGDDGDFPSTTPADAEWNDEPCAQLAADNLGHLVAGELPPGSATQLDAALERWVSSFRTEQAPRSPRAHPVSRTSVDGSSPTCGSARPGGASVQSSPTTTTDLAGMASMSLPLPSRPPL